MDNRFRIGDGEKNRRRSIVARSANKAVGSSRGKAFGGKVQVERTPQHRKQVKNSEDGLESDRDTAYTDLKALRHTTELALQGLQEIKKNRQVIQELKMLRGKADERKARVELLGKLQGLRGVFQSQIQEIKDYNQKIEKMQRKKNQEQIERAIKLPIGNSDYRVNRASQNCSSEKIILSNHDRSKSNVFSSMANQEKAIVPFSNKVISVRNIPKSLEHVEVNPQASSSTVCDQNTRMNAHYFKSSLKRRGGEKDEPGHAGQSGASVRFDLGAEELSENCDGKLNELQVAFRSSYAKYKQSLLANCGKKLLMGTFTISDGKVARYSLSGETRATREDDTVYTLSIFGFHSTYLVKELSESQFIYLCLAALEDEKNYHGLASSSQIEHFLRLFILPKLNVNPDLFRSLRTPPSLLWSEPGLLQTLSSTSVRKSVT